MEYWSIGVMEYWEDGMMECWKNGKMEYWSTGVMEYWKEEKTPAFPPSVPPLAGLWRTGANASAFVATLTSADKTAWQGIQHNPGMLE